MFRLTDMVLWPFNQVVNKALRLDPESLEKLSLLAGKQLAIEWRALKTTVFITLKADGVQLSFSSSKTSDALISSDTPRPMLQLLVNPNHPRLNGEVSLQGDVHLVQQLQQIFSQLSIDWEEHLAMLIGDGASHQAGKIAADVREWVKGTRENMQLNTREFLQQETQALPSRSEVDDFLKDIDHLRNDVERVAIRVKHLAKERGV